MSADERPPSAGLPGSIAFGDALRHAREERGFTLEAIAEGTRIARHHLDALERSDLDALPSGPFGKGYLKTYATLLGIDPEPLLADYRSREERRGHRGFESDSRMMGELSRLVNERGGGETRKSARRNVAPLAILATAVVFAGIGAMDWLLARRGERQARRVEPPAAPQQASGGKPVALPSPALRPPRKAPATAGERSRPATSTVASDAPPSSAVPSAAAPRSAAATSLAVPAHGVGTGLAARQLVGQADRFPEGTTLTFWTRVLGGQAGDVVRHVWLRAGQEVMTVELAIGGPHWRTHSRFALPRGATGPWAVEARSRDARLLARDEFVCEPVAN